MHPTVDPIVLLTESGCSLLIITENRIIIDIKKEFAARLKPLDGCGEKELAYKNGWNDAIMALIENRPIETNGNKGG